MPVITVDRKDFCRLVGKEFKIKEIEQTLPMMGVAWEGIKEDDFDVEVFPNRPDMLSIEGLARAFSAYMGVKEGLREYKTQKSEYLAVVDPKVKKVRPIFVCCAIHNVRFTDDFIKSIIQMQEKLHITHCRKRKKVAIGLHDLDKITFPITYTTKGSSFKFIPLEQNKEMTTKQILEILPKGKEYAWILERKKEYPMIIDSKSVVLSMPPIINSDNTRIDSNTKNVFVDITATEEKAAQEVLNIIATTFADRGGVIHSVKVKYSDRTIETPNLDPRMMNLDPKYVNKSLGLNLTSYEIIEYLQKMGLDAVEIGKDNLEVLIPCYRTDVMHAFDVVEDVAIAYGYERFEPEIPNIATIGEEDPLEIFSTKLRDLLIGYGLQEVMTFMLTNKNNLFRKMGLKEESVVETVNPKTQEYTVIRNWLIPNLLEVLSGNKHHEYPQNIFEVGDAIVLDASDDTGGKTRRKVSIALCHSRAGFSEMKSLVESLLRNLGIGKYSIKELNKGCYIRGRSVKVSFNKKDMLEFGEIKPKVIENWGLEMPVVVAEVNVSDLYSVVKG